MSHHLPAQVRVIEVGPRDGLQNEPEEVSTDVKIAFVDALSDAGPAEIEVTAFVHPRRVPRMADAEAVLRGIRRRPGIRYSALVPNERGLERAIGLRPDRISVFTAASETFNRRNTGVSIADSIRKFVPVAKGARAAGIGLRAYVSTAFVCPFEGLIAPEAVADVVAQLLDLGVEEVSIGDTIGAAVPSQVDRLLEHLRPYLAPERTALHLHDTRGMALANVYVGLQRGITAFDTTAGGLGGCPFAPGALGNLPTEDLLYMLDGLGIRHGVDGDALARASGLIESAIRRPLPSRVRLAGPAVRALPREH